MESGFEFIESNFKFIESGSEFIESDFEFIESSFEFMKYNDLLVVLGLFFGSGLACTTEEHPRGEAVIS
ncbi:MAG: hypothetical protein LBK25_07825 [Treponema sp.]|nr:hypothetical protein [Treponema sp.]